MLRSCIRHHAAVFRLEVVRWMPLSTGIWLWPMRDDNYDKRAMQTLRKIAICDDITRRWAFEASSQEGEHAMRICARAMLLILIAGNRERKNARERHDDEGVNNIDLEASSTKEWSEKQSQYPRYLAIWRGVP